MKAFIGADATNSVEHKKILDNPVFSGHYPRIEDRVFTMERFAGDRTPTENKTISLDKTDQVKRTKKTDVGLIVDPYEGSSPSQFTGFEHFLLCINVSLFIGIVLTMIVLGLFFLFLNSALYLKEEIS